MPVVRGKIFVFVIVFIPTTGVYGITRPGLSNKTLPTNHNSNLGHRAPPTESTRGDCHGYRAKHSKNGKTFAQRDGFFDYTFTAAAFEGYTFPFPVYGCFARRAGKWWKDVAKLVFPEPIRFVLTSRIKQCRILKHALIGQSVALYMKH